MPLAPILGKFSSLLQNEGRRQLPLELKLQLLDHLDGDERFAHTSPQVDDGVACQRLVEKVHLKPLQKRLADSLPTAPRAKP